MIFVKSNFTDGAYVISKIIDNKANVLNFTYSGTPDALNIRITNSLGKPLALITKSGAQVEVSYVIGKSINQIVYSLNGNILTETLPYKDQNGFNYTNKYEFKDNSSTTSYQFNLDKITLYDGEQYTASYTKNPTI